MTDNRLAAREQQTSYLSAFVRWLQLKKYQYEVTFSLYMMTSTEKFIFNLILFILVSMLVTAASLYLPNHVAVIYNRIWYYVHGEFKYITAAAPGKTILSADGSGVISSLTLQSVAATTTESVLREL
ncbi:hypothetical protein B0A52_03517 [Exophiala mesophila]|uniref:Uncharacterized protein n=1 Tax=Exophiala mesophila TaxID=212818 RepID=A0A438N6H5_EXOME|nr:hypothetical protein B0A52_03517 [Exophiala mesophila]